MGSAAAKQTWVDFCEAGVASPIEGRRAIKPEQVQGASPSDFFTDDERFAMALLGVGLPYVLRNGAATGEMYSFLCNDDKPENAPTPREAGRIKVHAVRQMTLQPWVSVRQPRWPALAFTAWQAPLPPGRTRRR